MVGTLPVTRLSRSERIRIEYPLRHTSRCWVRYNPLQCLPEDERFLTLFLLHVPCAPAIPEPYFVTTDTAFLGHPNLQVSRGNPLKGLVGGIRWAPPPLPEQIPLSIEFFNIGVSAERSCVHRERPDRHFSTYS